MKFFEGTAERLWRLPPHIRIRVQDINPKTGGQRIDHTTGERLWKHEDVNVVMYVMILAIGTPYILGWALWDELRAAFSFSYRQKRYTERIEYAEKVRKRKEKYTRKQDT